jgi:4-oxalocrotonate tautomerase
MPMVQITMLQGRTAEQKRKIAKRITDALVEEAGARREGIIVAFHEVSKESYASGGELMSDKVQVTFHAVCDFRQILTGVLQKMWRGSMGFERGIILILLIDEEAPRFSLVPVDLIHRTTWLLARFLGELRKQSSDLGFAPNLRHPRYRQNHHRTLLNVVFVLDKQEVNSRLSGMRLSSTHSRNRP